MNKDQVVPQWYSDINPAWFDETPWASREAVIRSAKGFVDDGLRIRLAGIWRVKEIK